MPIRNPDELTQAVLNEMARAQDPRTRDILSALVRHLHGFVREVHLTEPEFHQAIGLIARLGQLTNASHNEVALAAGSLGVSSLVCLQNNGNKGQTETTANLMGPFWRMRQKGPIKLAVVSVCPLLPLFCKHTNEDTPREPAARATSL